MNKDLDILKAILLEAEGDEKEVEKNDAEEKADNRASEKDDKPDSSFDKDPMGFILKKYHTLNELLSELMTPAFKEYITAIFIQSPKPTTFKIVLHNSQYFYLSYMGDGIYQAIIAGKRHYLSSIGEKERAMKGISRLLQQGSPLKTKGPEGSEQGTRPEGEDDGSISGGNNNGEGFACTLFPLNQPAVDNTGSWIKTVNSTTINNWNFYTVTYSSLDGSNLDNCKIYINGVSIYLFIQTYTINAYTLIFTLINKI